MADREHKKDFLVAIYDPMIQVAPILDHLREVGVEEEVMEVVSPLPLPGGLVEKTVHVSLYLITIIAGLVGIAVGIFFAGGTAAFYPLMTGGKAIVARPVGSCERTWRWCRRNPVVAGLMTTVAASLIAGTAISTYFAISCAVPRIICV